MEYLETLGVPVVGFRTRSFPGFYLSDSGSPLDWAIEDEEEAAHLTNSVRELNPEERGLVIANPIPPQDQLDPDLHDQVLGAAEEELRRQGIRGKSVTPFLLDYFQRETKGESLRANKQIIRNNARLAARIAMALAALKSARGDRR